MNVLTDREVIESAAQSLVDACHGAALASGWWIDTETGEDVRDWPPKFFKLWVSAKLILCVSEVAEGNEGLRKDLMDTHLPQHKMIAVEIGDMIIRSLDLAGGLGIDIGQVIADKLAYNAQRADHKIENRLKEGGKSF